MRHDIKRRGVATPDIYNNKTSRNAFPTHMCFHLYCMQELCSSRTLILFLCSSRCRFKQLSHHYFIFWDHSIIPSTSEISSTRMSWVQYLMSSQQEKTSKVFRLGSWLLHCQMCIISLQTDMFWTHSSQGQTNLFKGFFSSASCANHMAKTYKSRPSQMWRC